MNERGPLFGPGPGEEADVERELSAPEQSGTGQRNAAGPPAPAPSLPDNETSPPARRSRSRPGSLNDALTGRRSERPKPAKPAPSPARKPARPRAVATDSSPEFAGIPASVSTDLQPEDVYRIVNGRELRDTPWTRLVEKGRSLLTSPPAKEEERLDQALEDLRLRGLSAGATVALGSIKGGAGKTTLTLGLAEMLASTLRAGVLVVDADLEFGTASDSVPQASRHGGTLVDVHRAREQIIAPGQLAAFLVNLPGGAQLLAGPSEPEDIEQIDEQTMHELLELLRRFYPIILLDLPPGMGLRGSIPRWGFSEADDIVIVATPKRANIRQVGHMLTHVANRYESVPVTLALNMVPTRPDQAAQRVISVAENSGRSRHYAAIPQDPALERQLDAGILDLPQLAQPTRIALKDLTYRLASEWCR